jgi:hypothetical protein
MSRNIERIAVLVLCLGIGWFYTWTVKSNGEPWSFGEEKRDYYNLLIDGYLDGQLHMKTEVPRALLQVRNPYDPQERPAGVGLHDASFYRGRYYVYFGAAPMVLLMLPFRLLTGMDLPLSLAVLVFVYAGFLVSVAVWLAVRRRYFPETGTLTTVLAVLVLGLAGVSAVLLRRPDMWELPIAGGYCFAMLTLASVWQSLHAPPGARTRWFAAAGWFLGLAIASRPNYLIATPLLIPPLFWWWRSEGRRPWRIAVSAIVPLAVIGSLMAWHNYARFGNPLQFGQAYQLSLDYESKLPHFRAAYVPFTVRTHFFSAADWSAYFPFIRRPDLGEAPAGFTIHRGDVHGILFNFPIAWLAFLSPLALWRRSPSERGLLGAWLASVALLFLAGVGLMLFFFSVLARYQMDFAPAFMLLACVGLLGVERWIRTLNFALSRMPIRTVVTLAAVGSAVFGVLFSLQYEGLLGQNNPALQQKVARRLNHVSAVIERLTGVKHGALEMTLHLPASPPPTGRETLATIGYAPKLDRVIVQYRQDGRVQFGFVPHGSPEQLSRALVLDPSAKHRLRVFAGSLYPPSAHPFFAVKSADEIRRTKRQLRFELDGKPLLVDYRRAVGIESNHLAVGSDAIFDAAHPRFRGSIDGVRRLGSDVLPISRRDGPFVRVRFALPADPDAACEPLIAFGEAGSAGLLTVSQTASRQVKFGLVAMNGATSESGPFELVPRGVHELVVQFEAEGKEGEARMLLWIDGQLLWTPGINSLGELRGVTIGRNVAGNATCMPAFRGTLFSSQHDLDGRDPLARPGELSLQVRLPRDRPGKSDPLIVTGSTWAGDLLVIQYVDAQTVRFGLDHWGSAMVWSEPLRVDYSAPLSLAIAMPSLTTVQDATLIGGAMRGLLSVSVNGRQFWQHAGEFHRAEAEEVSIGRNPIGGTSAGPEFGGDVLSAERVARE